MASKSNTARKADLVAAGDDDTSADTDTATASAPAATTPAKGRPGARKGGPKSPSLTWDKEGTRDLAFIQAMLQVSSGGPIADIDKVVSLLKSSPAFAGSESLITPQKLRQRHGKLVEQELNFDLPALSGRRSSEPNAEFLNAAIAAMFRQGGQQSGSAGGSGVDPAEGSASMGVGGLIEE